MAGGQRGRGEAGEERGDRRGLRLGHPRRGWRPPFGLECLHLSREEERAGEYEYVPEFLEC